MTDVPTDGSTSLAQLIQTAITQAHVRGYRLTVLELAEGIVIQGTVGSYYHKQLAQEAAMKLLKDQSPQGFRLHLKNEIEVRPLGQE